MNSVARVSVVIALMTTGFFLINSQGNSQENKPTNSPTTEATPPPYPGAIDRVDCEVAGGWVANRYDLRAETKVEVYVDDTLADIISATTLRPDLTSWGSGRYGFVFKIPESYKDGKSHSIKILVAGTAYELPFIQNSSHFVCRPGASDNTVHETLEGSKPGPRNSNAVPKATKRRKKAPG